MKSQRQMLFAFIILLADISCVRSGSNATPAPAPTSISTVQISPISPISTSIAQVSPIPQDQEFFIEEFDTPLSNAWSILTVTGSDNANPDKVTVEAEGGKLVWNFDSEQVYYYLFYEGSSYTDVTVEVQAHNRGKNNNSISLICRYDPEVGWYEFNIANNGLYDIMYAEVASDGDIGYSLITNSSTNDIKQGQDVNEYSITCSGEDLTLAINGQQVNSIPERNYGLREGGVGVSVASFNVLPILVDMEWFKISEP